MCKNRESSRESSGISSDFGVGVESISQIGYRPESNLGIRVE